jgi:hypothetical protein
LPSRRPTGRRFAVRDEPLPDLEIVGELSDSAIAAIVSMLIDNLEREENETQTPTAQAPALAGTQVGAGDHDHD